jgi:branched-chain amino acid transport system ATP-binding protein
MLRVRNLEAGYGDLRVVKGVSFHVGAGEIVAVIGANGAGKTTLLNSIAGLVRPSAGTVSFKDRDVARETPERIVAAGCALVPEGRKLFAPMTVRENLLLGGWTLKKRSGNAEVRIALESVYALFPRLAERERQLAGTLSGGEQQMLAIGRALMSRPDLVMLDEPSMGLAPLVIRDIFKVIVRLREDGRTVLVVEQNAKAILKIANRGYVMETGNLILEGSNEELLNNKDVQRAYLGKEYASIAEGR